MKVQFNLTLFTTLNPRKLSAERKFFCDNNAGDIANRFETFVANCVAHSLTHREPSHVNHALAAAKALKQYRMAQRVLRGLIPFTYDKGSNAFVGGADKAKLDNLCKVIADPKTGETAPRWEFLLREKLAAEDKAETKAKSEWDLLAAVRRLVASASEHGKSIRDIRDAVEKIAA